VNVAEVLSTHFEGVAPLNRPIMVLALRGWFDIAEVATVAINELLVDRVAPIADLPSLLPEADVVVLACSLNASTRDLANEAFFKAMKPGSILVNIARGGVVVDEALLAALDRKAPAVAILDVFHQEPLPATSPYWAHPQVRVTAHTSAAGSGTVPRGDKLFLSNLKRYAAGEPLLNEVDPKSL